MKIPDWMKTCERCGQPLVGLNGEWYCGRCVDDVDLSEDCVPAYAEQDELDAEELEDLGSLWDDSEIQD